MAYFDYDEASAAGESKFVQSQEDPLYHVQVKIKDENEIDTGMHENINGRIKSEDYGERAAEVEYTDKEPKIAKLKIKLIQSKKKHKKKKKRKVKKELYNNVTEDLPGEENHEYKCKLVGDTVKSEADLKEENYEPEIKLEDIIKMEADDLDFRLEENINPQRFMDTSDERTSKYECDQCEKVYHRSSKHREYIKVGYIFLSLRNKSFSQEKLFMINLFKCFV